MGKENRVGDEVTCPLDKMDDEEVKQLVFDVVQKEVDDNPQLLDISLCGKKKPG